MLREFSANSNLLLKDSLTLKTLDFMREIAVPERGGHAIAGRFNALFTMTVPGIGVPRSLTCWP